MSAINQLELITEACRSLSPDVCLSRKWVKDLYLGKGWRREHPHRFFYCIREDVQKVHPLGAVLIGRFYSFKSPVGDICQNLQCTTSYVLGFTVGLTTIKEKIKESYYQKAHKRLEVVDFWRGVEDARTFVVWVQNRNYTLEACRQRALDADRQALTQYTKKLEKRKQIKEEDPELVAQRKIKKALREQKKKANREIRNQRGSLLKVQAILVNHASGKSRQTHGVWTSADSVEALEADLDFWRKMQAIIAANLQQPDKPGFEFYGMLHLRPGPLHAMKEESFVYVNEPTLEGHDVV